MAKDHSGKIAFVSGSGRGLGNVMARKLAGKGADIVVHDLSWDSTSQYGEASNLGDVIKQIEALGVRCMGITYSEANTLGSGLRERNDAGLTDLGRAVVRRMNRA